MDWYAPFQRTGRVLPYIALAGFLGFAGGLTNAVPAHAHDHGADRHHGLASLKPAGGPHVKGADRLEAEMGIRLVSLHTTAGGHMLDLRVRVVDEEKSHQVLKVASKVHISIIDMDSGAVAKVPNTMLGKLRSKASSSRTDQVYYFIFGNPHQAIKTGHSVKIVFGDVTVSNFLVM